MMLFWIVANASHVDKQSSSVDEAVNMSVPLGKHMGKTLVAGEGKHLVKYVLDILE
jgi:hypothetical protein